jgi:hypothetical protein
MSGLCDARRRVCVSCRQQLFAPRMVRSRRDRVPGWADRCDRRDLYGPRRDGVKAERPTLVRASHHPVHVLFHQHVGGPDRLVNLR